MAYRDFCSCGTITVGDTTSTSCNGDCIFAPHMLLATKDDGSVTSVDPCDATKVILWDSCLDDCGCGEESLSFEIETVTDNLTNVSIDSNGITFTSNAADASDYIAEITFIIRCGRLSDRGTLTIVFDNPCANITPCSTGYECNYCSGECVSAGSDLDVT